MLRRPALLAALTAVAALLLCAPGCRSYDTDPRNPPDQPAAVEEPGTGGSGSANTNDATGADVEQNRGEDLEDEPEERRGSVHDKTNEGFDPAGIVH